MDCLTCQGNGEIVVDSMNKEQHQLDEREMILARERTSWPYTCPACNGSGYLEVCF